MPDRDIIVIGGSAGAIAPLRQILGRLPPDLPAAICIVLHMPANGIGILSTVAGAAGRLPVRQAESGMVIENSQVYLAGPDRHLLVLDGHLMLDRGPCENLVRPAIDPLFRSAERHYGPRVIGVVLSGRLSDGAAGLQAIKRCGGITLVQDPADAISSEMPRRALQATTVDLCAPGARLGDALLDLVRERSIAIP
ncbi:chemotaxis response regulator CheB [Bradyrhizobium embrapense]